MRFPRILVCVATMLAIGFFLGAKGAGVAEGQEIVKLTLHAPSGHPGVFISQATFTRGGDVVGVFGGWLFVSGGKASATVEVDETPNDLEVVYQSPFNGTLTTYSIPPPDLASDVEYFLPTPSPGGTIGPELSGDLDTDAYFIVTGIEVSDDDEAPMCVFTDDTEGVIRAEIQDLDGGLVKIKVKRKRNATVDIPKVVEFDPPTGDPVVVTATVKKPNRTMKLILRSEDEAGNFSVCKQIKAKNKKTRTKIR